MKIVTDTSTLFSPKEGLELGITVLPLSVTAAGNVYKEYVDIQPTEFEAITAVAFIYFEKKKCDFVVLEVGLGGRLDSTNIIEAPYTSVIASISLDHTAILGDTIEEIAAEKCGIIKFGASTVAYPFQDDKAMEIIKKTCENKCSDLIIPDVSRLEIGEEMLEGIDDGELFDKIYNIFKENNKDEYEFLD